MVYQFKKGSQIKANAQIAGEMCERLSEQGNLTAKALLDANRPEDAPLHNEFEWRDGVAAEKYREAQARHIINCLIVEAEDNEPVRAFFNIVRTEAEYHHVEAIFKSLDDTEKLLQTALNELKAFQSKYKRLQQLAPVFDAMEQIEIA